MTQTNFLFCSGVASIIHAFSQFPQDVCNWIACQFALESSFGESSLAHSNNNYCGMSNPLIRISSAIHAGDPIYVWAQYDDLFSCCIDYLLCVQYHRPLSSDYDTIVHYSRFISKFYCPEEGYIDKVNLIYSQFNSFQNGKN